MSQAVPFMQEYLSALESLVKAIEVVKFAQVRAAADSTLVPGYFASSSARPDLTVQNIVDANNAALAIVAAYDAGTNKAKIHFVL